MKNQELLTVAANAPHDSEVFVMVDGRPIAASRAEYGDGTVMIIANSPAKQPKPTKPASVTAPEAKPAAQVAPAAETVTGTGTQAPFAPEAKAESPASTVLE